MMTPNGQYYTIETGNHLQQEGERIGRAGKANLYYYRVETPERMCCPIMDDNEDIEEYNRNVVNWKGTRGVCYETLDPRDYCRQCVNEWNGMNEDDARKWVVYRG